jgi:hypothetical protein
MRFNKTQEKILREGLKRNRLEAALDKRDPSRVAQREAETRRMLADKDEGELVAELPVLPRRKKPVVRKKKAAVPRGKKKAASRGKKK